MAILTGTEIIKAVERGDIRIDPFNVERVGPNSYDVSLGEKLYVYTSHILDCGEENQTAEFPAGRNGWEIHPGVLVLGSTAEKIHTDKYVPLLDGRSTCGRLGLRIHQTAGFGDIGFSGAWTLELDVVQPVRLKPGVRVGQISFHTVEGDINTLYRGVYAQQQAARGNKPLT